MHLHNILRRGEPGSPSDTLWRLLTISPPRELVDVLVCGTSKIVLQPASPDHGMVVRLVKLIRDSVAKLGTSTVSSGIDPNAATLADVKQLCQSQTAFAQLLALPGFKVMAARVQPDLANPLTANAFAVANDKLGQLEARRSMAAAASSLCPPSSPAGRKLNEQRDADYVRVLSPKNMLSLVFLVFFRFPPP